MRIACPHCAAVYTVPDEVLAGEPRMFRCARCAFQWVPPALGPAPVPRAAPAIGSSPLAVVEIPPRPALPALSRLEADAPAATDGRPRRVRLLSPAPLGAPVGAASFGVLPFDGDPRGSQATGAGGISARTLGTVAGIVGWALTVALVIAAIVLLVLRQPQIEALWPPSQRLYALLGMH